MRDQKEAQLNMQAYLFVHFSNENTADSEQIYFAVSEDGMSWKTLNNSTPVLRSELGEKGLRDPHILRSMDGKKFYGVINMIKSFLLSEVKLADAYLTCRSRH